MTVRVKFTRSALGKKANIFVQAPCVSSRPSVAVLAQVISDRFEALWRKMAPHFSGVHYHQSHHFDQLDEKAKAADRLIVKCRCGEGCDYGLLFNIPFDKWSPWVKNHMAQLMSYHRAHYCDRNTVSNVEHIEKDTHLWLHKFDDDNEDLQGLPSTFSQSHTCAPRTFERLPRRCSTAPSRWQSSWYSKHRGTDDRWTRRRYDRWQKGGVRKSW